MGFRPGFNDCPLGETEVISDQAPFALPGFPLISPNGRYGNDYLPGKQIEVDFDDQIIPNVTPPGQPACHRAIPRKRSSVRQYVVQNYIASPVLLR